MKRSNDAHLCVVLSQKVIGTPKSAEAGPKSEETSNGEKRLKSSDYQGWDKFNVEKECAKVDQTVPGVVKDGGGGVARAQEVKLPERGEHEGDST